MPRLVEPSKPEELRSLLVAVCPECNEFSCFYETRRVCMNLFRFILKSVRFARIHLLDSKFVEMYASSVE